MLLYSIQRASLVAYGKHFASQRRSSGPGPWVGKIPWRSRRQCTPVFLSGRSHGWRSLVDCSPRGHRRGEHDSAAQHNHSIQYPDPNGPETEDISKKLLIKYWLNECIIYELLLPFFLSLKVSLSLIFFVWLILFSVSLILITTNA